MIRFLTPKDYDACLDVILDQREFLEEKCHDDYRSWIQPLSGWLNPEPYERFKGSFLSQNKKLTGFFHHGNLITFSGLICYEKTDVAISMYRVSKTILTLDPEIVFNDLHTFIFEWGVSLGKREFFSCRHPKLTPNIVKWIGNSNYFSNHFHHRCIATYAAYEIPSNNFHYEIMEFSPHAFPLEINQWTYL